MAHFFSDNPRGARAAADFFTKNMMRAASSRVADFVLKDGEVPNDTWVAMNALKAAEKVIEPEMKFLVWYVLCLASRLGFSVSETIPHLEERLRRVNPAVEPFPEWIDG